MKKKILSITLAAVMVAMMIPFAAIFASADAAPTYADTTVALVNGVEVAADGLQAAVSAAPNGGTIEIVKDFTLDVLAFNKASDGYEKEWTVNGNNKTITSTATTAGADSSYLMTFSSVTVEFNNLKIVTKANGIQLNAYATVTLNDCEIYTGGTKEGLSIEAATRPEADIANGSVAINVASYYAKLVVDGGTYKAYGPGGYVLNLKGTANLYDGNFVGEDTSFVVRATNDNKPNMAQVQTVMNIYGGLYIKPVINRNTTKGGNNTVSDGGVLRADKGAIANIYGGQFANFSDVCKINGAQVGQKRDYLLLTGESSNSGFVHIFGGDFYSFMTANINASASQLIGTFAGQNAVAGNKAHSQLNFFIYGGNFYSSVPTREYNVNAIANKTADSINRIAADMYTATTTESQTVSLYGQEFTGVTKWAIAYNQPTEAPAGATVKVTTADNKVYYLKDTSVTGTYSGAPTYAAPAFIQAINAVAQDGSTVDLLADVSVAQAEILNRDLEVTINGNNKTLTITGAKGFGITSGDITVKDLKIVASASTYAVAVGFNSADTIKVDLVLKNCDLTCSEDGTALNVAGVFDGTIKTEGLKVAGAAVADVDQTICAHIFGEMTVVTPATHAAAGLQRSTCTKCNAAVEEEIAQVPHDYTAVTQHNENQHKKTCSCSADAFILEDHSFVGNWTSISDTKHAKACECGYALELDHDWDDGVVTTPATHTTEGSKVVTCATCQATKTVVIPKIADHAHGDWTKVDDAKHSKTCACGDVIEADHAWDEGVVTTEPTVEAEGVKTYTCADCGATKTESIEKLPAPDTGDNTTPDAGNADGADDAKSGCGNAIGFGAVAVVAVAGLACTLVAKKRED